MLGFVLFSRTWNGVEGLSSGEHVFSKVKPNTNIRSDELSTNGVSGLHHPHIIGIFNCLQPRLPKGNVFFDSNKNVSIVGGREGADYRGLDNRGFERNRL